MRFNLTSLFLGNLCSNRFLPYINIYNANHSCEQFLKKKKNNEILVKCASLKYMSKKISAKFGLYI